jgi:antitoxin VapB
VALSIKDPETDRLIRDLAEVTGESMTEAVRKSVEARLIRERRKRGHDGSLAADLIAIGKRCAAAPDHDTRSPDEMVGYDEHGMW